LSGAQYPGSRTNYYKGYHAPAPQFDEELKAAQYPLARFGDPRLQKTDAEARAAAERVAYGNGTQKQEGYSGVSYLHKRLPYLSHINFWLMPVAHAVLKGIVENFVDLVLQPIPKVRVDI
jgi:hypothetical protein